MNQTDSTTPAVRQGPSRDMLGGPVLGVVVFLFIAVLLGWGATQLLQGPMQKARLNAAGQMEHTFDLQATYQLNGEMLLGWNASEQLILYPGKQDLPHGSPNRRIATRIDDYRKTPSDYPEVVAVLAQGTQLRILSVIDDPSNQQTRLRLRITLLTGPHAGKEATALYLGKITASDNGDAQYTPRLDLIDVLMLEDSAANPSEPIQSDTPTSQQP